MQSTISFSAKTFVKELTSHPGVYQMLDQQGKVLYVGKAKNLKKRIASYFRSRLDSAKTAALVKQIADIRIIVTETETEALLLENNLIKEFRPHYNVLFRDDKSYPYILVTKHPDYPRIALHRGKKKIPGRYYGPYPNVVSVRDSLNLLQKLFRIRPCNDNFFRNRSRPCLQYHIKRCTGPCVNLITPDAYQQDVALAHLFLQGKNQLIIDDLMQRMDNAARIQDYETAAYYRDQMIQLRQLQEQQCINVNEGDVDVIAIVNSGDRYVINILFIRNGQIIGNHSVLPKIGIEPSNSNVLSSFIAYHYLIDQNADSVPARLIISHEIADADTLSAALQKHTGRAIQISHHVRGERLRWLRMASTTAQQTLLNHLAQASNLQERFAVLQQTLGLPQAPIRIECFDISHTLGEATVASCVVFDLDGPRKNDYRRFNITDITPGDDYAAMQQALLRRYQRAKNNLDKFPDILLIDGGKGQLAQAEQVLTELDITGIIIVGVAKGPDRKAGLETLWIAGKKAPLTLAENSGALHLIQQIRDEAHRFAITAHRQKRAKARRISTLEDIPGIGNKRRQALLRFFGGLQQVKAAGTVELAKVPGISKDIAQRIYDELHPLS